jgi:hypothetical protein
MWPSPKGSQCMSTSCMVGAVGIEPGRPPNSQQSATDKPQSIFAALTKQLTLFEGQLPPTAASTIRHAPAHQQHPLLGTWGTNLQPPFKFEYFVRETLLPQIARQNGLLPICPLSGSVYNRFSQACLRLLIGEIGGNSTKRPFRLPLDIATRLEKWI